MLKTTIDVEDNLWRRFSLLALRERGDRKKNEIIGQLIKDYVERKGLPGNARQLGYALQIEEERSAFLAMRDQLVQDPKCRGRYVALYQGKIIGCEDDKARLAQAVYEKYGYVPIYIDRAFPGQRRIEIPSPELTGHEV